jgi:hypothetical protein
MKMVDELESWVRLCEEVSKVFSGRRSVGLSEILDAMGSVGMQTFHAEPTYKNIRLARVFVLWMGADLKDTEKDWLMWRNMSPHVRDVTKRSGVWTYASAVLFRNAMRQRLCEPHYSFSDLICFLCLQDKSYIET